MTIQKEQVELLVGLFTLCSMVVGGNAWLIKMVIESVISKRLNCIIDHHEHNCPALRSFMKKAMENNNG